MAENELVSADDVLRDDLRDPAFRAEWERTALARAVALRVVRYRAEHGLTQRQLAERLGVAQSQVARLESGEHEPTLSTLSRLSGALGLSIRLDFTPGNEQRAHDTAQPVVEDAVTQYGGHLHLEVA